MSQTPNEPDQPGQRPAGEGTPPSWGEQQPGAAPPPGGAPPEWGVTRPNPTTPGTQPYPAAPPPPGGPSYPAAPPPPGSQSYPAAPPPPGGQPQWGEQPQWGGQPQWGEQPQWSGQPQWGAQPAAPGWAGPQGPGANPWSAKPPNGIIPLRPLALGELYDGAFQAIRSNPRTMIGLSAIVVLIVTLVGAVPQAASLRALSSLLTIDDQGDIEAQDIAGTVAGSLTGLLVPQLLSLIAITVLSGMLMVAVSAAVLGRRTPLGTLWVQVRRRVLALILLAIVTSLVPALVFVALFVPGIVLLAADSEAGGIIALLLGILAGFVLWLVLWVKWSLSAPALLLEDQGIGSALGRSWYLTKGAFWRLLGILLLTVLIVTILSAVVGGPFRVMAGAAESATDNPLQAYTSFTGNLIRVLITGIGTIVAGSVLYPFSAAVTALLYVDVRMRREGLDVELMRAVSGES